MLNFVLMRSAFCRGVNVCELERQNYFCDVKPFVLVLTSQFKG